MRPGLKGEGITVVLDVLRMVAQLSGLWDHALFHHICIRIVPLPSFQAFL